MRNVLVASLLLASLGCESTPAPTDAGEPESCDEPDRACPGERPHEGAPCAVAEPCFYVPMDGEEWTYTCTGGEWVGTVECMLLGGGCTPPLAETCARPVTDHGAATVEIGPVGSGAFTPFAAGQMVPVVIGGQGSPMVQYRLRLPESVPSCVEVITTLRSSISMDSTSRRTVRLRCGRSLGMFEIVPSGDCTAPPATVDTELEVEVTGIGSATANIVLSGDAFCAPLPG